MHNYLDYYGFRNNYNFNTANISNNKASFFNYATDPKEGFFKGNLFSNLYLPYKNYKVLQINPNNEKEHALLMLQIYGFAAHDLGLYLDINPNDIDAINLRNQYINLYKQVLDDYQNKYGALDLYSNALNSVPWGWDSKKWPWEGEK